MISNNMVLSLNIGYDQLLGLVKQLPKAKIQQLQAELNGFTEKKVVVKKEGAFDFESFLLAGPVMTEEGYSAYKENRKQFSQWRKK